MSLISKLGFPTKTNKIPVTDRTEQATAEDFNEIKTTVNEVVDGVNFLKVNEVAIVAGINNILFQYRYPTGTPYGIITHRCYDADGYEIAHEIPDSYKNSDGFRLISPVSGTLFYSTQPQR